MGGGGVNACDSKALNPELQKGTQLKIYHLNVHISSIINQIIRLKCLTIITLQCRELFPFKILGKYLANFQFRVCFEL